MGVWAGGVWKVPVGASRVSLATRGANTPIPARPPSRGRVQTTPAPRRWITALLTLFCLLFAAPALADPTFPPLTGRVVDDAHVLSPDIQADLTQKLAALQAKTGDQLVVVTLPSLQGMEISDYGYQLGRAWGIGQKDKNTGALFIVAPAEKKVRVEVGYGLEPVLTDTLSSVILTSQVLPRFRQGDIPGGVVAGTDALIQQLGLDPQQAAAQVQQAQAVEAERPAPRRHDTVGTIFSILLFVFVVSAFFRGGRRGGGMGWILPMMFMGGGFGGRDRDDGWGGGGGGDGGGFSGGGGSFGGGGASGGW